MAFRKPSWSRRCMRNTGLGILYGVVGVILLIMMFISLSWDMNDLNKLYMHKCYAVNVHGHPKSVDCLGETTCSVYQVSLEVRLPTCNGNTIFTKNGVCRDAITCATDYGVKDKQLWCVSTGHESCPLDGKDLAVFLPHDAAIRHLYSMHTYLPRFAVALLVFMIVLGGGPLLLPSLWHRP